MNLFLNVKIIVIQTNTKNANALTGVEGYNSLQKISINLSKLLNLKQISDEDNQIQSNQVNCYLLAQGQ